MIRTISAILLAALAGQALAGGLIATIPNGSTSQIIRIPLVDQDTPDTCPSTDLTNASGGLIIGVGANNEANMTTYTTTKILTIATPGTYAAPTNSDEIRFAVVDAGSCWYELQIRDERFAVSNADRLYIEITDGAQEIMDDTFWVDLTAVNADTLVDSIWSEPAGDYASTTQMGGQIGVNIPAILTDTGTTLPAEHAALPTAAEVSADLLGQTIGTYDGETVDVACALAGAFATLLGEMTVAGGGPTITFKTPDGVSTIGVITMSSGDRTGSVITCP